MKKILLKGILHDRGRSQVPVFVGNRGSAYRFPLQLGHGGNGRFH
jgi:hypothetical protein